MLLRPISVGVICATVISSIRIAWVQFPQIYHLAIWVLGAVLVATLVTAFYLTFSKAKDQDASYLGLADLLLHIHLTSSHASGLGWFIRGLSSFLLSLVGFPVGPEGAAGEWSNLMNRKTRPISSNWFELHRRTDAAIVIASSLTVAFSSPIAGIVLPMEMRIGGNSVHIVLAVLSSALTTHLIDQYIFQSGNFGVVLESGFNLFQLANLSTALSLAVLTVACGALGGVLSEFAISGRAELNKILKNKIYLRVLLSAVLLLVLAAVFPQVLTPAPILYQQFATGEVDYLKISIHLLGLFLCFSTVLIGFGSIGVFWPLLMIGGLVGALMVKGLGLGIEVCILIGSAGVWGAALNAPLTGAIIGYEMSGNPEVIVPCLIAAFGGRWIRMRLGLGSLTELSLRSTGNIIEEGRSVTVLKSLFVKDVMTKTFDVVHENINIEDIKSRLEKSSYPFLPVVDNQSRYMGLITADMVARIADLKNQVTGSDEAGGKALVKFLEARDLLYRYGSEVPTVRKSDDLSVTSGLFELTPVVPVLSEQGQVEGLLFVFNVRTAYDRETAKRFIFLGQKRPELGTEKLDPAHEE